MDKLNFTFAPKYKEFIDDFLHSKHKEYSIYGGRDSGKSTTLYMLILLIVMMEGCVVVIRRHFNSLRGSSFNGICKIIRNYGLEDYFIITKSPLLITCKINGYTIEFKGLDDYNKVKSSETSAGAYRLAVFEEAQEIENKEKCEEAISSYERGEGSFGFRTIYVWNPPGNKNHWLNLTMRDSEPGYRLAMLVNYYDIPKKWVGQDLVKIERCKRLTPKVYRNRYLGEPVAADDLVFENVELKEITDEQIEFWLSTKNGLFAGMDFGYRPDPNAACMMHYDIQKRTLYIFKEFHGGELNNKQISDGLDKAGFYKWMRITSDKDEKTIKDLKDFGWDIKSAIKGPGSVETGFEWLSGLDAIIIDPVRCPYTSTEFSEYHRCFDKAGNIKSGYKDTDNQADHHIAAVRYGMEPLIRKAGM